MNVDKGQARKMVLVGIGLFAAIEFYKGKGAGFKQIWNIGFVGFILTLLADFAPTIAGPFAILLALGAFTGKGGNVLATLESKVNSKGAAASTPHTGPVGGETPGGPVKGG